MTFDQTMDRAAVEERMLDTCTISRDPEGVTDDTLNEDTLELEPAGGDRTTIYTGPCSLAPYSIRNEDRTEGERDTTRQMWHSGIHKDGSSPAVLVYTGVPAYGDLLVMDSVHEGGDQSLVGRRFIVTRVGAHTLGVRRPLVVQDEKGETEA